jgi:hypothetical protein
MEVTVALNLRLELGSPQVIEIYHDCQPLVLSLTNLMILVSFRVPTFLTVRHSTHLPFPILMDNSLC